MVGCDECVVWIGIMDNPNGGSAFLISMMDNPNGGSAYYGASVRRKDKMQSACGRGRRSDNLVML